MRTSFDLPDDLYRHLKTRAALQGATLREVVLALIEQGLRAPSIPAEAHAPASAELPSISLGAPMAWSAADFSNARLAEQLDE